MKKKLRLFRSRTKCLAITGIMTATSCFIAGQNASAVAQPGGEFTLDAEFDTGSAINVVHSTPDQLQLDDTTEPFNFIWMAVSSKGTVVKVDTETGEVLGEYRTAPQGRGLNPSRTTVDLNGNVWVGNRNENGSVPAGAASPGIPTTNRRMGSVVHFGLEENGGCVDRNGNGVIDTSTGLGDVRGWSNVGNADIYGGISTAEDECIINYVRVNSTGTRHVSVNADNDVWVSGTGGSIFDLIDSDTGNITRQESSVGYGGYGGLIDGNGVIWSARNLLRWDTALPLSGSNGGNWTGYSHDSYGLCIDGDGNVWNTSLYNNQIRKFAPDGILLGTYSHGSNSAQGCVVDNNGDVWVAHSIIGPSNSVGHLLNDGTFVGNVTVGSGPTGVAVDAAGKIWATNYYSKTASRIDPNGGPIGVGGVSVGAVDFTTGDLGGNLYNYSDMTGSTLSGAPDNGTWTAVHDAGMDDVTWNSVSWTADKPGDSSIVVTVASSEDCVTYGPEIVGVINGGDLSISTGRYLRLTVSFTRSTTDDDGDSVNDSPILYDISVDATPPNEPPVAQCKDATLNLNSNGQAVLTPSQVDNGSSDPDSGDAITFDLSRTNFTCADIGIQHAVTLTVTDDGGLSDSCVSNVTVVDNLPPVPNAASLPQVTGQCSTTIPAAPTATDNCAGTVTVITTDPLSYSAQGTYTVTWTFDDGNGNTATQTQQVVVDDNTPPSVQTRNVTVQLDANGNASITAADINNGSDDNCGIASMSVAPSTFTCADVGANTVTLTITDNNGNVSTATATVTVEDNVAPTAVVKDITVQLDASGNASITADDINNGSSDNCEIASVEISQLAFTCANVGANTVTLTITDNNGNVSTATATVTVADIDLDGDGVKDCDDLCPETASDAFDIDADGCSAEQRNCPCGVDSSTHNAYVRCITRLARGHFRGNRSEIRQARKDFIISRSDSECGLGTFE
ncbi:MAG: hypothetical protein GY800_03115 [Planctomycetes bacterium]|nr:hypothetical protein [Planctomycetota bacterium]